MISSDVAQHDLGRSLHRVAQFKEAWRENVLTVNEGEALLQSAIRSAPRDEGLLRLSAWTSAWEVPADAHSVERCAHHLERWLRLGTTPQGQSVLSRLGESADSATGLLAAVVPSLLLASKSTTLLSSVGVQLRVGNGGKNAWWLPLQCLIALAPRTNGAALIAWQSVARCWDLPEHGITAATLDQPWLNDIGAGAYQTLNDCAWSLIRAGLPGRVVDRLMGHDRAKMVALRSTDPMAADRLGTDALLNGLRLAALVPLVASDTAHLDRWLQEAQRWIDDGARLPHDRTFDLSRTNCLPKGMTIVSRVTFDGAVELIEQWGNLHTITHKAWYDVWCKADQHETLRIEQALLRTTATDVLDEVGSASGHLKTRRRL